MSLENSPETDSGDDGRSITDTKVGRRAFVAGVGASALAVGGAGSVAAQSTGINFSSPYAHESVLSATTTFAKVDMSRFGELEYEDDSGTVRDLSSTHGVRLAPRPETEEDTVTAHNPVRYPARRVESDEFTAFPRETYELDTDGNPDSDMPVSWVDSSFWSTGTGMTIVEGSGDALLFSGTDGSATFSHSEWSIDDDVRRHHLLVVLDVVSLSSGSTVAIRASDSSGTSSSAELLVDDTGDPSEDGVVATSTGDGYVYQLSLGELSPGVSAVDQVEVDITGTAEVRLHGLNLDRTSPLYFGEREVVETDDDGNESLSTESVATHSGGPLAITSLDTVGSGLRSSTFREVEMDVEQRARDLPSEFYSTERNDTPTGYEYEDRFTLGFTHKLPAAYDLEHNITGLVLRGAVSTSRYFGVGYSTPSVNPDDVADYQDLTLTDVTGEMNPAADDPETQLVASFTPSDGVDVVIDLALTPGETRDLMGGGMGGFALASSGSGGSDGPLAGVRGVILLIASIVGGAIAWTRGRL